jgi:hypothetical protein
MMKPILAIAILTGGLLLCQQTNAVPISGSIQFSGSANASGPSGGNPVTIHFLDPWQTVAGTGSYLTVPPMTLTTFNDFTFTGDGTGAMLLGPDRPIWTFTIGTTTYSFDLLALTNGHVQAGSMNFNGTGIAHITGLTDTPASFALEGAGTNFNFVLSSSTTSVPTPDGGATVVMLAVGLVLVELVRRTIENRRVQSISSAALS